MPVFHWVASRVGMASSPDVELERAKTIVPSAFRAWETIERTLRTCVHRGQLRVGDRVRIGLAEREADEDSDPLFSSRVYEIAACGRLEFVTGFHPRRNREVLALNSQP